MTRTHSSRSVALIAVTAALALAACSKQPDSSATQAAATQTEEVFQEDAAPETGSPAETEAPAPSEGATAGASFDEIPGAVRGRWGLVPADCTSTKGDAKGLLEVSADQLTFYESVAKLGTIKEVGESRIRATFAYTGEGQSWTQDVVLDAQNGGKTLIRRDYGKDAMPGPLKYTRCT